MAWSAPKFLRSRRAKPIRGSPFLRTNLRCCATAPTANRARDEPHTRPKELAARSHDAETIAERVAAKRNGRPRTALEFLLACRAGVYRACQHGFKIVDVKIDVNRRPVPFISAHVVGSPGRPGARRLFDQSDLGVAASQYGVDRDGSSDLRQSHRVAIKAQAFIELRNVDRYRVLHAHTPFTGRQFRDAFGWGDFSLAIRRFGERSVYASLHSLV